jgi:hypothetical protein
MDIGSDIIHHNIISRTYLSYHIISITSYREEPTLKVMKSENKKVETLSSSNSLSLSDDSC